MNNYKIKVWVARDRRKRLQLFFFEKPIKMNGVLMYKNSILIPNDYFPNPKEEDNPIEVELSISRVIKTE